MPWEEPPTWIDGPFLRARQMNIMSEDLRQTAPAKAQAAGDLFYATGPNAITRLAKGNNGQFLAVRGEDLAWESFATGFNRGDLLIGRAAGQAATRLPPGLDGQILSVVNGSLAYRSLVTPSVSVAEMFFANLTWTPITGSGIGGNPYRYRYTRGWESNQQFIILGIQRYPTYPGTRETQIRPMSTRTPWVPTSSWRALPGNADGITFQVRINPLGGGLEMVIEDATDRKWRVLFQVITLNNQNRGLA